MNRKDCITIILHECISSEGFLPKLRGREFDQEGYDRLLQAIRVYRDLIRGETWIEREVTYCLYYLDLELAGALDRFPRTESERIMITKVQIECSELILEVFTPEYMTGPIPPEFE